MVAVLEKITFSGVSFGGHCNLFRYGVVQDCLQKRNFEFSVGNLYGIIGEFGEGGATLSCGITGNTEFYEGKIYIDGIEKDIGELVDIRWYIGNDLYKYRINSLFCNRIRINKKTIKEQIEYGVRCQLIDKDFLTIQKMFNISSERIERNINYVGFERWKASAAIGYANGKRIFCCPWMNSSDIEYLREQLSQTVNVLIDEGCVVIFPITKEENIKKLSDKNCMIYL